MNLRRLVERVRTLINDFGGDRESNWPIDDRFCIHSNRTLVDWLEQARTEYLTRNPIRAVGGALGAATVPAGGRLTLDPRVLYVHTLALVDEINLPHMARADLDLDYPGWRAETGQPRAWCCDEEPGTVRLWPAPEDEVAVRMVVDRLALEPFDWAAAEAEVADVPEMHHEVLACWAAARAVETTDLAPEDKSRVAARWDARFALAVGPPLGAQEMAIRRRLAAGALKVRGIGLRGLC